MGTPECPFVAQLCFPFRCPVEGVPDFVLGKKQVVLVERVEEDTGWALASTTYTVEAEAVEGESEHSYKPDIKTTWLWVPFSYLKPLPAEKIKQLEATRKRVFMEIIDTEATYLTTLSLLTGLYATPLRYQLTPPQHMPRAHKQTNKQTQTHTHTHTHTQHRT